MITLKGDAMLIKRLNVIVGIGLALAACAGLIPPAASNTNVESNSFMSIKNKLPDLGPAADFNSKPWINTDQALTLETLRGKVILVEFWTFG